jgi:hypothetical protein
MSADRASYSNKTTRQRLQLPLNGTLFTTTRPVSPEKETPAVGGTMESELGKKYAFSRIIAVDAQPGAHDVLVIQHAVIPSETEQLASNWEHSTCDIGGRKFDAVNRTVIMLASAYSESEPAIGSALPANPQGSPDLGSGYVLADRQATKSGLPLEPVFRVERRSYVKKVTLSDVVVDAQTGIGSRVTTTLYYHGEIVTGTSTIQSLIADPANAFWAVQANGYAREGQQLTEKWYQVVEREIIDLETQWEKGSDRRRPTKYFCPQDTITATVITTNNEVGEPSAPGASSGQSITVGKVGKIQKVTTTTQGGNPQVLKSLNYMADDGKVYPQTDELVTLASVPTTAGMIDSNGRVIEYNDIDGCDASKVTRQAVSLENAHVKSVERLAPARFLTDQSQKVITVTQTGVTTEPDQPTAEDRKRIKVEQKGAIRTTETIEQIGTLTPLPGLDFKADDGTLYPTTTETVPRASVPLAPSQIATDGTIIEFNADDANWATKTTRKAVSTEPETTAAVDRMIPESFLRDQATTRVEQVNPGVIGPITPPPAEDYKSKKVTRKGAMETLETISQTGTPEAKRGTSFDQRTGEAFPITQEVVPATTAVPTPIRADGTIDEFDPLNVHWSIKTQRKLVSTLTRTWTEIIDYEWPPVLLGITFKIWQGKNGRGDVVYPIPRWKAGFRSPQAVQVNQYWQLTQPVVIPTPQLVTDGFRYQCPLYSITIPPCLHTTQVLSCTISSSDPDWESQTDSEVFPATPYTDWPDEVFWRENKPYLGGYLVTEYTLQKPV